LAHKVDPNLKGPKGYTALHVAAAKGDLDATKLLLAHGAEVNSRDGDGNTPLHYTVFWRWKPIVELLLDNKADPNLTNEAGQTPLAMNSYGRTAGSYFSPNEWGIPMKVPGATPIPDAPTREEAVVHDLLRAHGAKE